MTTKQLIRIHTAAGAEDIDADRLQVQGDEYVLLRGDEEIRRVKIADLVPGEEHGGIETVYSRS
jgi:hypothetical protein